MSSRRKKSRPFWLLSLLLTGVILILRTVFETFKVSGGISTTGSSDYYSYYKDWERGIPILFPGISSSNITATTTVSDNKDDEIIELKRFYELKSEILLDVDGISEIKHRTAYHSATVVERAGKWFTPKYDCKETCCVRTVAISLEQDNTSIINTVTGSDLADTVIVHYPYAPYLNFHAHAPYLNEDLIPCLLPGTIIQFDNHAKVSEYFFLKLRRYLTSSYVVITSESDANSPDDSYSHHAPKLTNDSLLIKWYGTNPDKEVMNQYDTNHKFVPLNLGLSKNHLQSPLLTKYLQFNQFMNPFVNKTRWTTLDENNEYTFFVNFRVHDFATERREIFDSLCTPKMVTYKNTTFKSRTGGISCSNNGLHLPADIYSEASKFLFGISPPGAGLDCYRTYEFLILGIIPVIETSVGSEVLFHDLPVVQVENLLYGNWTRERLFQKVNSYVRSDAFLKRDFSEGWKRLFVNYWRRRILSDANRAIYTDPSTGKEYYEAYEYSYNNFNEKNKDEPTYCYIEGNCMVNLTLYHLSGGTEM